MIDYDKFKKALNHLQLQFDNYKNIGSEQPKLIQEAVAESVIQRFETCYDCLWKVLKRYLIEELGLPEVPNSPKPIFRRSHENNLFASTTASTTIDAWLKYADARIGTSHDYSGQKAADALELMEDFINDAIGLYQTISGQIWP